MAQWVIRSFQSAQPSQSKSKSLLIVSKRGLKELTSHPWEKGRNFQVPKPPKKTLSAAIHVPSLFSRVEFVLAEI
jgi:hypothetical protein